MAKGRAVAIVLDDVEKRELTALTRKHGGPQALAERAHCAGGIEWAQQQGGRCQDQCLRCDGWHMAQSFCRTPMDGLYDEPRPGAPREIGDDEIASTISVKRWRRDQRVAPIGASGAWLKRLVTHLRRCIASGAPSVCNRIASRLSSSPPIRCSSGKCAILSGSICRRPNALSCCVSMRKARCRRSTDATPIADAAGASRAVYP